MRDNKSLLLALLAAGLVITWVYHIYDKSQYSTKSNEVLVKDTLAVTKAVSDSLREFFANTLHQLSSEKVEVDSVNNLLSGELDQKVNEINTLKAEISDILKKKTLTQADLTNAQFKIDSLKKTLAIIKLEKQALADKGKKLNTITSELTNEISLQQDGKTSPLKPKATAVFNTSSVKLVAYGDGLQNETETKSQENAKKLIASFTVKNNLISEKHAEIIAIVTDPAGKSIIPEVWDAGSFETKNEGRKVYTKKINFDYNKGEAKHIIFSVEPDNFEKGVYKLSLYQNGVRIGVTSWKLS